MDFARKPQLKSLVAYEKLGGARLRALEAIFKAH